MHQWSPYLLWVWQEPMIPFVKFSWIIWRKTDQEINKINKPSLHFYFCTVNQWWISKEDHWMSNLIIFQKKTKFRKLLRNVELIIFVSKQLYKNLITGLHKVYLWFIIVVMERRIIWSLKDLLVQQLSLKVISFKKY